MVFVATLPRGQRRIGLAMAMAGAMLFALMSGWADFIND